MIRLGCRRVLEEPATVLGRCSTRCTSRRMVICETSRIDLADTSIAPIRCCSCHKPLPPSPRNYKRSTCSVITPPIRTTMAPTGRSRSRRLVRTWQCARGQVIVCGVVIRIRTSLLVYAVRNQRLVSVLSELLPPGCCSR